MSTETVDLASLEARLRRAEDLIEIQQLFVQYGRYLDRGDFAAYAALFAADGELMIGPMGRAKGPAEIEAMMSKTLEGRSGQSYHLITAPIIELDGDQATSEVMWTVLVREADGSPRVSMTGRHRDELVREGGRWKFRRRRGYVDIPSKLE
jgi:ketosteroid isomerase-like protein